MYQKKLKKHLNYLSKVITPLNLSKFFLYAFVFLLPFQINVIIYAPEVFVEGNFNPFTSVFIYLTDFLFLFALVFWAISIFKHEYKEKFTYGNAFIFMLMFLFLIFAELSVLFAEDQWLSFNIVIRIVQFLLLYIYIINKTVKLDTLVNVFLASVTLQALIAILQYVFQGSIGLSFLGESFIGPDVAGVAKIDIEEGAKIIRPYGTLPHPNILAGYLLTGIFLAYYKIKQKKHFAYPVMLVLIAAFILAFSRGAFLAFLLAALVYFSVKESKLSLKYIILFAAFLLFFVVLFNLEQTFLSRFLFTDTASFNDRIFYFNVSKSMFWHTPFGVGLGNFTLNLPDFTSLKLAPWQYQPVHNSYMLMLNEMGIQGALAFISLFVGFSVGVFLKMKKAAKDFGPILLAILASIFVVGMFDHYTASLYHGMALLFLIFALCGKFIIKESH
ncbi:O-antigen ligase family protein [Patescibacteria group bacterium]